MSAVFFLLFHRFPRMNLLRRCSLIALATLLAGCGSDQYRITLKDGREFIATGKPEFQTKTGYYQYENPQGRDALIRADEVLIIEPE